MNYPTTIWVCLMALTPIILSHPHPPAPIDPALKIKLTSKAFIEASHLITSELRRDSRDAQQYPVQYTKGGVDYKGFVIINSPPTVEITTISGEELHRVKREYNTFSAKSSWGTRDPGHGGLKVKATEHALTLNLTGGETHYVIHYTDLISEHSAFFGQNEGQIQLKALEAEVTGKVKIVKNGVELILTNEEADGKVQEFLDFLIEDLSTRFQTHIEGFTQVIELYEKVLFDFRLTQDPEFKDGGVQLSIVGRFVHDKDGIYKKSSISDLHAVTGLITQWKSRDEDTPLKEEGKYMERFNIFEDGTFPLTTALAAEGSDEAEADRRTRASILVTFGEDLFNSLIEVGVESGLLDLTFSKDTLRMITGLYNLGSSESGTSDKLYVDFLPEGTTFRIKVKPNANHKYVTISEEGVKEEFTYRLSFAGLKADYYFMATSKWLYRNRKLVYDINEFYIEKIAEEGYPKLVDVEKLQEFFNAHIKRANELLFTENHLKWVTELSHTEGNWIVGIDFAA